MCYVYLHEHKPVESWENHETHDYKNNESDVS